MLQVRTEVLQEYIKTIPVHGKFGVINGDTDSENWGVSKF